MRKQTLFEVIAICISTALGLLITVFLKANYLQECSLQDTIDLALLNMLMIVSFFIILEEIWRLFDTRIKEIYFYLIENESKLRETEKRKQEAYKKYEGVKLESEIRSCETEIQMIGEIVDREIRYLEKHLKKLSDSERQKITEIKRRRELGSV